MFLDLIRIRTYDFARAVSEYRRFYGIKFWPQALWNKLRQGETRWSRVAKKSNGGDVKLS